MSAMQNQKQNFDQSLSFEDVSKLFPLPLSEAADILGVSTSVLKKICNENGLERWPHRKYLAGKSIEEIKTEAVKEKTKTLGGNTQSDRPKNNVTTGAVASSSPGSHAKNKSSTAQQQGSKPTWGTHQILASGLAMEASAFSEELKYGFPSSGLSSATNKWWGSGSVNGVSANEAKATLDPSETQVENNIMKKSGKDEKDKVSLSTIRKRALDEGQKALKSGVLKKHGADHLRKEEKILLRRLFQTS